MGVTIHHSTTLATAAQFAAEDVQLEVSMESPSHQPSWPLT